MESHPPSQAHLPLLYAKPLGFHSDKLLQSPHLFVGHLHISCGAGLELCLGTLTPEAPQCSGRQGNDQPLWRPHFPFCLRTQLRQSLFKLMFFHSKHLANFFPSFKDLATHAFQINIFFPMILQSPLHISRSGSSCCGSADRPIAAVDNQPLIWCGVLFSNWSECQINSEWLNYTGNTK